MPRSTTFLANMLAYTCVFAPLLAGQAPESGQEPEVGILVMAHGGSPEWNETVVDALAPVSDRVPTVLALGMADPETLQAGLDSLAALGVAKVAVVRMFISGASFLDQTRYLLGLSDTAPEWFMPMSGNHVGAAGPPAPLAHSLEIATHHDGLMVSEHVHRIVATRAASVSAGGPSESVLILAHGMGDDVDNDRVLEAMRDMSREIRALGFDNVESATLREDWDTARDVAESAIRDHVRGQTDAGRRVIVVPLRLSGFGPYAEVLSGLDYTATEGLLPHDAITNWIRDTASGVFRQNGWPDPIGSASTRAEVSSVSTSR